MQAPVSIGEALILLLLVAQFAAAAGAAVGYLLGSRRP